MYVGLVIEHDAYHLHLINSFKSILVIFDEFSIDPWILVSNQMTKHYQTPFFFIQVQVSLLTFFSNYF